MRRQIITIDDEKCDGCGLCIPNCPEGALGIVDGKARLVSEVFCDGLGACMGHCPRGAIAVEERDAEVYDERKVIGNMAGRGEEVLKAHLEHLEEHGQVEHLKEAISYLVERDLDVPLELREADCGVAGSCGSAEPGQGTGHVERSAAEGDTAISGCGCPGSRVLDLREADERRETERPGIDPPARLRQWPVQIHLVPPDAPFLKGADLLIAADCVPFAYAGFHENLLAGKALLVGCPKLDDSSFYIEKLGRILQENDIRSITVAHMEVPCCFGMMGIVKSAIDSSGREIPLEEVTLSIRGRKLA